MAPQGRRSHTSTPCRCSCGPASRWTSTQVRHPPNSTPPLLSRSTLTPCMLVLCRGRHHRQQGGSTELREHVDAKLLCGQRWQPVRCVTGRNLPSSSPWTQRRGHGRVFRGCSRLTQMMGVAQLHTQHAQLPARAGLACCLLPTCGQGSRHVDWRRQLHRQRGHLLFLVGGWVGPQVFCAQARC